jgi:hypothetical protein
MNDIYIQARKVEMYEEEKQRMLAEKQRNAESSEISETSKPDAQQDVMKERHEPTCDKENSPPEENQSTVAPNTDQCSNMELRDSTESSKSSKRRLTESCDSENIPPKRPRSEVDVTATESTDNNNHHGPHQQVTTDCSSQQQISCLVQRFNSGLNGLFATQKCCSNSPLQDSQGHSDVLSNCCATQLTKDAVFSDQIGRPVIALTV